jgi:hypothetical protein
MSSQTLSQRFTTDTREAQPDHRDVAIRRETSRSRTAAWTRMRSLLARPRGHVIGRAIGEPPAPSLVGRPRGHVVVGNALPSPEPATYR